ncbi:MAG TPA: hypothetical protein DEB06_09020 [Phycisphaerales bacterium]|nr:hypothetical protein [Phycisphaerales bacterium]
MSRDTTIQAIAALVIAGCVVSAGWLVTALTAEAGRAQLVYTDQAAEGDPPEVAVGVAMGAFRGLFVNYLWIRANRLKEEGKFYEAMQLSSAITKLQPRFPRVWVFHAWNMAYNISVATNTREERWQWVRAGVDLLRSKAIPRNPNDTMLHKELAWIFNHKIQGFADDANHYYKKEVAKEWTIILGPPPRMEGTRDSNIEAMIAFLRPIADAPDTIEGLIARELADRAAARDGAPSAEAQPSRVKELVERLGKEAGLPVGPEVLRFFRYRLASLESWLLREQDRDLEASFRNEAIDALMLDPNLTDAWSRLIAHIARRVIIDDMHMEPERMIRFTRKYGPLDWRHPSAHAIYWSARGVEEGLERDSTTEFDTLNTDRITMHSIQELFRFGTVQYDLVTDEYFALNNFDWVDAYSDIVEEVMARGGIAADTKQRAYTLYGAGYENFMRDVIRVAYNRGQVDRAERYHQRLRTWEGLNINDPALADDLKRPLSEFVMIGFKDRVATPHVANAEIENAIIDALLTGLAQGRPEVFARQMAYAKMVRDAYMETQNLRQLVDTEKERMASFVAENLADFFAQTAGRVLAGEGLGGLTVGIVQAGGIFRRMPVNLQRLVYDQLMSDIRRGRPWLTDAQAAGLFPEPPGMAEFRAEMSRLEGDARIKRQIQFLQQ